MHRALQIPELVAGIVGELGPSRKDVLSTALVSRQWFGIAVDLLWREVRHMRLLFKLFPQCIKTIDPFPHYKFERDLEVADFDRFCFYASRIRELIVGWDWLGHSEDAPCWTANLLEQIAKKCPTKHILPNLQSLGWWANYDETPLFHLLHDNVREFQCHSRNLRGPFFQSVLRSAPSLSRLLIGPGVGPRARPEFLDSYAQRDLITMLSGLEDLRIVEMPAFIMTSKMVETLAKLPHLWMLSFDHRTFTHHREQLEPEMHFQFPLDAAFGSFSRVQEGDFPVLSDLWLSSPISIACKFFPQAGHFSSLTSLGLVVPYRISFAGARRLSRLIHSACPRLEKLSFLESDVPGNSRPVREDRIPWDVFEPVIGCKTLRCLKLYPVSDLRMTQQDLEQLASSLPLLEQFLISPQWTVFMAERPSLTLLALVPFATFCPKLKHLHMFLSPIIGENGDDNNTVNLHMKLTVQTLTLDFAPWQPPYPSPNEVALFLSRICPTTCTVYTGEDFSSTRDSRRWTREMQRRRVMLRDAWIEMGNTMGLKWKWDIPWSSRLTPTVER